MMAESWISLILAAGKGTRMNSDQAKVLHPLEGKSLLSHVLDTAERLEMEKTIVVVGHQAKAVREAHRDYEIAFALQEPQLGTGHAVLCARDQLEGREGSLLVLYGDVPLLRSSTLRALMEIHLLEENGVTVLTASLPDPTGYGRIFRDSNGRFSRIVEDRDLEPEDRSIQEINSGIYVFQIAALLHALDQMKNDNAQGEYYLTDTLEAILADGLPVGILEIEDAEEISGINTPAHLEDAGAVLQRRREEGEGPEGCEVCDDLLCREELILHRAEGLVVVLAPRPYNSGHLWITPERHVVSYESLRPPEAEALFNLSREAEGWLDRAYRPQGFNFGYNSGRECGHLIAHVIPRWTGDSNFMPLIGGVNILPETLDETRRRLLEAQGHGEGN